MYNQLLPLFSPSNCGSQDTTTSLVEIFLDGQRIASPMRNYDRRRPYRTEVSHMPTTHKEARQRWNERRFLSWAASIGPHTKDVVVSVLNSRQVIQQAYPACMALLNLAKEYGNEHLEQVCGEILKNGYSPRFTNVKNLLAVAGAKDPAPKEKPARSKGLLREH